MSYATAALATYANMLGTLDHLVGKASEHGPCLIRLEYKPKGGSKKGAGGRAKSAKPVVLIGKTMVYDSGGLSLKIGGSMPGMKRDKDGGCAVFGGDHVIAFGRQHGFR